MRLRVLLWLLALALWTFVLALPWIAHAVGPVNGPNKCSVQWDAPTTNTDGTPLTDLKEYQVWLGQASGQFGTAPYRLVASSVPNPALGVIVTWDCRNVGLADGQYYLTIRAVDLAGNVSPNASPPAGETWTQAGGVPFVFDGKSPAGVGGLKISP